MSQSSFLRSSTFRLALIYMALFGGSVLLLLTFIYWSTARYMAAQADATIEAEIRGLADRYRTAGLAGLTDLISERVSRKPGGSSSSSRRRNPRRTTFPRGDNTIRPAWNHSCVRTTTQPSSFTQAS